MNSKFIAREFLVLIGIIPCLLIGYFYYNAKKKSIEKDITISKESYDSVMNVFGPHNREYYRRLTDREPFYVKKFNYEDNKEYPSYSYDVSIWKRIEKLHIRGKLTYSNYINFSDKIKDHLKLIGINSIDELKDAVAYVYISPEYTIRNENLQKKRNELFLKISSLKKSRIDEQKIFNYLKNISIWYILIMFVLRYFLFTLIWSIKTLKT